MSESLPALLGRPCLRFYYVTKDIAATRALLSAYRADRLMGGRRPAESSLDSTLGALTSVTAERGMCPENWSDER